MKIPEVATDPCKDREEATRVCAERDKGVRTCREIATGRSSRSECDGFAVAIRPQNAAYWAIAFTGSAPESDRERTCSWIAVKNCLILTQGASKIEKKLYSA
ncbi:hypothetical protein Taro_007048 [Colocasia esculenta]|uniref:Uncharacterized protein n=1 Tax=Colocasia esculenta TaxID=4460 RepID=A0A843TU24_COLES|nr:hypothetical protein [Colocasia esculenta]